MTTNEVANSAKVAEIRERAEAAMRLDEPEAFDWTPMRMWPAEVLALVEVVEAARDYVAAEDESEGAKFARLEEALSKVLSVSVRECVYCGLPTNKHGAKPCPMGY